MVNVQSRVDFLSVLTSCLSVPAGELMCPPVLLRSTLVCLRIWTRATTRWPSVFRKSEIPAQFVCQLKEQCAFSPSLPPSLPTPPSPLFKGGAIILNTQEPEYLSYTRYALLLLFLLPPAAFLVWLFCGYGHAQTKRLIRMEVTIEMLSKPFSGHLNRS